MKDNEVDGNLRDYFTSNREELLIMGASLLLYGNFSDHERWYWFERYCTNTVVLNKAMRMMEEPICNMDQHEGSWKMMNELGKELKKKGYGQRKGEISGTKEGD